MGKRGPKPKKKPEEIEEEMENEKREFSSNLKKNIVSIVLIAFAVVSILGFIGNAGILGRGINKGLGLLFGWSKWLFPLMLVGASVILIFRKKVKLYVLRLIGLGVIFVSFLAVVHLLYGPEQMLEMAKMGKGGGFLGYGIGILLVKLSGVAASFVILFALLIIGFIAAFNFSPQSLWDKINKLLGKKEEQDEQGEIGEAEETEEEGENEEQEEEKQVDEKNNIGKVEFVEGPDSWLAKSSKDKSLTSMPVPLGADKKKLKRMAMESRWQLPPLDLMEKTTGTAKGGDIEKNQEIIQKTFHNFGIEVEPAEIEVGPTVTQYSFRPAVGVKLSKITALNNDLALSLAAHPIRIEAPIPGKSLIGIEVPNKVSTTVRLRGILEDPGFRQRDSQLVLALGEDVSGEYMFSDLAKMPHLMIAGATGTGKSVGINTILATLLYQNSPRDLKLILVDPKRVELSLYNGIPHLLTEVIVENKKVVNALKWAVSEMERRYRLLQDTSSRDLDSYNEKINGGKKRKFTDPETGKTVEEELEHLPYIVIVIDELADLMSSHGKEVEGAVVRIAQMARAVGIHLIVSTQRPSVEVLTGLIKANITTRIAFQVATQIDSRTILDMAGAEKLLGKGDMLFLSSASPKPKRVQGIFISEAEVKKLVKFLKKQGEKFEEENRDDEDEGEEITEGPEKNGSSLKFEITQGTPEMEDDLYEEAKQLVIESGKASTSLIQRRLRVGYSRAARLIDMLEEQGIVGPAEGSKPREILIGSESQARVPEQSMKDEFDGTDEEKQKMGM